jgi:Putative Zn-dependent protease, contains TPR repeats
MRRTILAFAAAASLSACAVSTQQEVQMGVDEMQQVNAQLPIINDPELSRYINVLGIPSPSSPAAATSTGSSSSLTARK